MSTKGQMTATAELRPCPFCGGVDLRYMFYGGCIAVHCRGCGIEGPFGADDDEAAEKWNRRAEVTK